MSSKDEKTNEGSREAEPVLDLQGKSIIRIWSLFFLTVVFVLFLFLLWKAIPVMLLLFSGILVAIALRFVSDNISKLTGIGPLWSVTVVILFLVAGGIIVGILSAPTLLSQVKELASNLQESLAELEDWVMNSDTGRYLVDWIGWIGQEDGGDLEIWGWVAGFFTNTFGAVAAFFLTLIVGIFFAYNPGLYLRGFLRLIPLQKRDRSMEILNGLADTLRWWMVGQLISMIVLAVSTWLMLLILGVPLAFILGLLTGLLTFIPYLGPIIALLPILLIAFVEDPVLMLWVLALYLVIQNVEANVLMPIIFQQTVHLPPVLTIIAQILLGTIFGFVGIILATPLMATGIELVKLIYVEDVLGDSMKKPIGPL